jgi:hypothetical protein
MDTYALVSAAVVLYFIWYTITFVQIFFAYGTAYRFAKSRGDNGVSLYGWLLVFSLAAMIPGLGIYLWYKYKEDRNPTQRVYQQQYQQQYQQPYQQPYQQQYPPTNNPGGYPYQSGQNLPPTPPNP